MHVGNIDKSSPTKIDNNPQTEVPIPSWQSRLIYYIPIIPFVSTPLGVARCSQALYFGACSIYRLSRACFSYHSDRMLSRSDLPQIIKRQWKETYEKETRVLKKVQSRLARGILEIIPIIGNIAIYYSVWYQGGDRIRKKIREIKKEKSDLHKKEGDLFSYLQTLNRLTQAISKEAKDPANFCELQGQVSDLKDEMSNHYNRAQIRRKRSYRKHVNS